MFYGPFNSGTLFVLLVSGYNCYIILVKYISTGKDSSSNINNSIDKKCSDHLKIQFVINNH